MIDKICTFLTNKIRQEMTDVDDERAEVINYGLQNIIGEIPKFFIVLIVAYLFGIFKETLLTFFILLPYRSFSGGVHLKTHMGCIISTCLMYCGVAYLAKSIEFTQITIYILAVSTWVFGMIMIKLYAPADTENVPILRKKERRQKQILSYVVLTVGTIVAVVIPNTTIANVILLGYLVQSCMITRFIYKITDNKYGYEVYNASH
jgi:accessory gene regulator B